MGLRRKGRKAVGTDAGVLASRALRARSLPRDDWDPRDVGRDYDAVFLDPPFANVTPRELRAALEACAAARPPAEGGGELVAAHEIPLFLGYNGAREAELLDAFAPWALERKPPALGYASNVMDGRIFLYGPRAPVRVEAGIMQPDAY